MNGILFLDAQLQTKHGVFSEYKNNFVLHADSKNFTVGSVKSHQFLLTDAELGTRTMTQATGAVVRTLVQEKMPRCLTDNSEVRVR